MSAMPESGNSSAYLKLQELLRDWLPETGATRVDIEYNVIALTGDVMTWIMVDGERKSVHLPSDLSFTMYDIRPAQVDPHRGAWLWSHFWMEAAEGVLHQGCDWMREPVIGSDPVGDGDAAFELDQFPRDPEWIPEWMATKAAAYHKEAERRERRRQRDRERRAKKKAEAAQAEGTSGSDGPAGE